MTATSGYEGFPTFWELTLSPAQPDDGDRVSSQNVWKPTYPDVAVAWENLIEFCCHESYSETYLQKG